MNSSTLGRRIPSRYFITPGYYASSSRFRQVLSKVLRIILTSHSLISSSSLFLSFLFFAIRFVARPIGGILGLVYGCLWDDIRFDASLCSHRVTPAVHSMSTKEPRANMRLENWTLQTHPWVRSASIGTSMNHEPRGYLTLENLSFIPQLHGNTDPNRPVIDKILSLWGWDYSLSGLSSGLVLVASVWLGYEDLSMSQIGLYWDINETRTTWLSDAWKLELYTSVTSQDRPKPTRIDWRWATPCSCEGIGLM